MVPFGQAEDPRRRTLIRALAAGLYAAIGFAPGRSIAQSVFSARPAKLPEGQSIYRLSGDVQVNDKPATLQTRIAASDTIKTGRNAEIVYVVGDNAFILRGDSQITLQPAGAGRPRAAPR